MKRSGIPKGLRKFVRIEAITNAQSIPRLSDARSTSVQVSEMTLFNPDENFR